MDYRTKQRKAKLDSWYICYKLDIQYKDYVMVKTGKKNLAGDKLDIFKDLTYKNNNEWINQESLKKEIDEWYRQQTTASLKEKLQEFNVNQPIVAEEIGCDSSSINRVINNPHDSKENNIKYLMYFYLTDENNRRNKPSKRRYTKKGTNKVESEKIEKPIEEEKPKKVDIKELDLPFNNIVDKVKDEIELNDKYKYIVPISSFVKKEDYDRKVEQLEKAEKELNRFRYLIDQLMNK